MNEADHKRKLVAQINALPGACARRVEDRWAKGRLDLIIKLPEMPGFWAEGKLVKGNLFAPTLPQFLQGEEWIAAGMEAILIGWNNKHKEMYVSPWVKKAHVDDTFGRNYGPDSTYVSILMEYLDNESRRHAA